MVKSDEQFPQRYLLRRVTEERTCMDKTTIPLIQSQPLSPCIETVTCVIIVRCVSRVPYSNGANTAHALIKRFISRKVTQERTWARQPNH